MKALRRRGMGAACPGARSLSALVCGALFFAAPARAMDSSEAKALFKNPPRAYSTGPLWTWNDLLTEQEIRDTLRDLARQQVKQVWVHPRPGLMTPYLSADWFRLWKAALKEARRLDMNVWIYDENSYPSGFAGGLVPDAMPESRGRGLAFRETKTAPQWSDDIIGVYRLENEASVDVTAKVKTGEALPEAQYLVAAEIRAPNTAWNGNRCYVNLLSPGVTEKFLEVTLEAYRREIGGEFGRRVPGVFTDEPNIRPAKGLPWSETLVQAFQQRWGYSLLEHLPSLSRPVGDWRKIRHNYYQVLNEQFIEHWSRPYHDYCASNHLEWTGHYWDHEWPNCTGVPDNMAMYAWHQRPAIDCLMNQFAQHTHAQFGNLRMVRELASVANQLGRKRTLCETYGAGGWDLRFEDMKRIGDWLEVLGVNTINQHLSYVTIRGARKRDHPQSFSYHEPWWEAYHVSAEYLARLSAALSQGDQINTLLVLEPTTTAWMYQGDGAKLTELGDSFFKFLMVLEAAQVEYDIGSEDILARHGSIAAGKLRVARRDYSTVLLPPYTENLNAKTEELLAGFMQAGGSVLSCGEPPGRLDGSVSSRGAALAASARWKKVDAATVVNQLRSDGFAIERLEGDKGILFHQRRQLDDGQLLFLVNSSIDSPAAGQIESDLWSLEQWDLRTGKAQPYPFQATELGLRTQFHLAPSGSLLLFLSREARRATPPGRQPQPAATTAAGYAALVTSLSMQHELTGEPLQTLRAHAAPEIRRLEPNVLTLDYVDISAGGDTRTNLYVYQANQFAWRKNGLERDPWDSAVQFKDELIAKKFPTNSGFEASYRFTIESSVPTNLAIVIERPDLYRITCNGQLLKPKPNDWWLDRAFGRMDLASAARMGENVVTVKASPFTMFHELEAAYVLGNFTLKPADKGFIVGPDHPFAPGSCEKPAAGQSNPAGSATNSNRIGWNLLGHPFYSAGVSYRERFDVDKPSGRYVVALPSWYGSVAKVTVNGRFAGYIDAPPWECEVSRWLLRGRNDIEVIVIGTLKNTLGPHHGNPALGVAWPGTFQKAPESGPPPGAAYSTVAYGLFEPFVLKRVGRGAP